MEDIKDITLLRRYVQERSEDAFHELVRRKLPLVYSAALRQLGGNVHQAKDVTQAVFIALATQAKTLVHHPSLTGWLYKSTRYAALATIRTERRRQRWESESSLMHANETAVPQDVDQTWAKIGATLDEAMHELKDRDRGAVLLRYFEGQSLAAIGGRLGITEDAARMRIDRALGQLQNSLARRGIVSTTSALMAALAKGAITAAPVGLAATISSAALTTVAAVGTTTAGVSILTMGTWVAVFSTAAAVMVYFGSSTMPQTPVLVATQAVRPVQSSAQIEAVLPQPAPEAVLPVREAGLSLVEILTESDDAKAAEHYAARVASLPLGDFKNELLELIKARASKGDFGFDKSLDLAGSIDQWPLGDPLVGLLLRQWGKLDPAAAMAAIEGLRDEDKPYTVRFRYADVVLEGWALEDPEAAWAWAHNSISGAVTVTGANFNVWAYERVDSVYNALILARRFEQVGALILKAPDGYGARSSMPLITAWVHADPVAAMVWLGEAPSIVSNFALHGLGEGLPKLNEEAIAGIMQKLDPESLKPVALGIVDSGRTAEDMAQALQWMRALAGDNASGAYDSVIGHFIDQNRARSSEFSNRAQLIAEQELLLAQIRSPNGLLVAAKSFVVQAQADFPDKAIQAVVQYLPSPADQTAALTRIGVSWAQRDYPAASAYVNGLTNVSEEVRQTLNTAIQSAAPDR